MQKKYLFLLSLCTVFLIFNGCRKDSITEETIFFVGPTENDLSISLKGQILDQLQKPLSEAIVTVNGESETTDENGYFNFPTVPFSSKGSVITAEKSGYIKGLKRILPNIKGGSFVKIGLLPRGESAGQFNSLDGGLIDIVSFSKNSISKSDDSPYQGNVEVYIHHYPPSVNNYLYAPGNLDGLTLGGEEVRLESYGMVFVELIGENGEILNLTTGKTATINFPIQTNQTSFAPTTIPLWSMQEELGIWIEEGTAHRQGDTYVAQVSHFSFWNCDDYFELIQLDGSLLNSSGAPIAYKTVQLSFDNGSNVGNGATNEFGQFSGKVPKDKIFKMSLLDACSAVISFPDIGPFNTNTTLPSIVFNHDENQITLTGTFSDCTGANLTNGYLKVLKIDSLQSFTSYDIIPLDDQGSVNMSLLICGIDSLKFQVIDAENLQQSPVFSYSLENVDTINLGSIIVCESLLEYISVGVDITVVRDNPVGILRGDQLLIRQSDEFLSVDLSINMSNPGDPITESALIGFFDSPALGCNNVLQEESCLGIVETNFTLNEGLNGYAQGTIVGQMYLDQSGLIDIEIAFRVFIEVEQTAISGLVWSDENSNGLRDMGEPMVEGVTLVTDGANLIQDGTMTDENGAYTLFADNDTPFDVVIFPKSPYLLTDPNVGVDDLIDSDFDTIGNKVSGIIVNGSSTPLKLDAGFIFDPSILCLATVQTIPCSGSANGCITVTISGQPVNTLYTIQIGDLMETTSNAVHTICGISGGTYEVTVTFPDGNVCIKTVILQPLQPISLTVDFQMISCEPSVIGQFTIVGQGGTPPYQYAWGDGQMTSIVQVPPGPHTLTITDAAGCTNDFILDPEFNLATIGGIVWRDDVGDNQNVFDANDMLLPNVTLDLNTEFDQPIATVKSDENGQFSFSGSLLEANKRYYIRILPIDYDLVDKDVGLDDTIDSDADPISKVTDLFTIEPGCFEKLDFGFGLVPE